MPFFKSKEEQGPKVDFEHLPRHVAIIMDGNGRWAKRRGLPRTAGHAAGAETFRRIATYCKEIGLDYLTVYAFSTENWIPGSAYKGALCFYNGTGTCRRALFRESVLAEENFVPACSPNLKQAAAVYRTAMLTNPFFEDVPLLVDDVRVARNGKDYTLLDNAGNAVRVAMPEETFIDILAITGGNPFASLVIVNGDIWELKSIWYNKEYHTWRDERN